MHLLKLTAVEDALGSDATGVSMRVARGGSEMHLSKLTTIKDALGVDATVISMRGEISCFRLFFL